MVEDGVTEADVNELVELMTAATSVFIRGDIGRYVALMDHAADYTLMGPTGGDTVHGFDDSDDRLAEMASFFKTGDATLEIEATYASGDLAVLVAVERQHGEVGDYPPQDWSLRVTLVFHREASRWRLAHRHADALVHPITFDKLAELARG